MSRREERKEETRAELIEAAGSVFARRGYHGASLDEIAREARYSTGAIYWHFKNKDELFLAVLDAYTTARVGEVMEIDARVDGGLPKRARAYADQWMERLGETEEIVVLTLEFVVHAWRNPDLRGPLADRLAAMRLALARIIERDAKAAGVTLPLPASDVATALREMGVGLGLARLADPDSVSNALFGDFVEQYFELIQRADVPVRKRRARTAKRGSRS